MSVEQVVVSIGALEKLLSDIEDTTLQQQLKVHTDAMLRGVFDHCMQRNRLKRAVVESKSKIKFPSPTQQNSYIPSLADPAIKSFKAV